MEPCPDPKKFFRPYCEIREDDGKISLTFTMYHRDLPRLQNARFRDLKIKTDYVTYPQRYYVVKKVGFDREFERVRTIYPDLEHRRFSMVNGEWDTNLVSIVTGHLITVRHDEIIETFIKEVSDEIGTSTVTLTVTEEMFLDRSLEILALIKPHHGKF
ncbi:Hypothetical protein POVR1_LOCUS197 [uncultured virus]|nr:Hypothetical protein POVR1_LOCUS197 [uncultured virus]